MLAKKEKIALGQEKLFRTIAYCQTSFHTHNDSKYKAFPSSVVCSWYTYRRELQNYMRGIYTSILTYLNVNLNLDCFTFTHFKKRIVSCSNT